MSVNFNDAPIGTPAMKNDAQHHSHGTLRNMDAIKHMGDFSDRPKPVAKPTLRNEDAIKHMGDPSKPGPSADESKKGVKRARARKAKAKTAKAGKAGKASSRKGASAKRAIPVVAADQPKAGAWPGPVVAADTPSKS